MGRWAGVRSMNSERGEESEGGERVGQERGGKKGVVSWNADRTAGAGERRGAAADRGAELQGEEAVGGADGKKSNGAARDSRADVQLGGTATGLPDGVGEGTWDVDLREATADRLE